jgi:dephospho-CoA kinase
LLHEYEEFGAEHLLKRQQILVRLERLAWSPEGRTKCFIENRYGTDVPVPPGELERKLLREIVAMDNDFNERCKRYLQELARLI